MDVSTRTGSNLRALFIIGLLFFMFGFISWINSILIPYFKLVCRLDNAQAMLVTFAFYISYFVMAFPSSAILKRTGLKNGMTLGLVIMAIGALLFIPAAWNRQYILFLVALFIQATGLTILQTASNPYITVLGPIESAAQRISIMGMCNKIAGALAPLLLLQLITTSPDEIDQLEKALPSFSYIQQNVLLDELSGRLAFPYGMIAAALLLFGLLVRFSDLPDLQDEDINTSASADRRTSLYQYPYLMLGVVTIFCSVSVEVLVVDSVINYGQFAGYSFREAKFFAMYTFIFMMISYVLGVVAIPRYIPQSRALQYSALAGVVFTCLALFTTSAISVWYIALLGFSNALLWPSIWPLAIDGLGKFTRQGSAFLVMAVIGGAVTPLLYGYLSDNSDPQNAYGLLIPCYLFILFFAVKGHTIGKRTG